MGRAIDEVSIVDTMGVKSVLGMQSDHPGESAFLVPIGLCVSAAQGHFLKLDKQLEGGSGRWPPGLELRNAWPAKASEWPANAGRSAKTMSWSFHGERMAAPGKDTTMKTMVADRDRAQALAQALAQVLVAVLALVLAPVLVPVLMLAIWVSGAGGMVPHETLAAA